MELKLELALFLNKIDGVDYKLCGLKPEEIAVVEGEYIRN